MTDRERNGYGNLIYLCANCHRIIDAPVSGETDYPVDRLKRIKSEHENRIHNAVMDAFPDVGFPELGEAVRWIDENVDPGAGTGDFLLVSPRDKLNKNELGGRSEMIVVSGLSVAREVQRFVEFRTQTDRRFPERLKEGFSDRVPPSEENEGNAGRRTVRLDVPIRTAGIAQADRKDRGTGRAGVFIRNV